MWWNWAGIVILLNVVVHAQLSAPTRFRVFETDPPATFIGDLPYIWLPAFLVPLAWRSTRSRCASSGRGDDRRATTASIRASSRW